MRDWQGGHAELPVVKTVREHVRILIAASDGIPWQNILLSLGEAGYGVLMAGSAVECLAQARLHQPDLIILNDDVAKPDLVAALKTTVDGQMPPVVLIGFQEHNLPLADTFPAAGIDGVLLQPVSAAGLRIQIDAHLGQRGLKSALQASEQRYREIVEHSPDLIFINRNDRIIYVNPAGVRLLRAQSDQQIIGRSPFEIIHPDFHAAVRERIGRATLATGAAPALAQKILALDGTAIDVEVLASSYRTGGHTDIQVVCRDISQRLRVEENLHRSRQRHQYLFEQNLTGNFVVDTAGRLLLCNASFASIMGFVSADQALGSSFTQFADTGDLAALVQTLASNPYPLTRERWARHCNGQAILLAERLVGIRDPHGRLHEIQGYILDITATRHAEQLQTWETGVLEAISSGQALQAVLDRIVLGLEAINPGAIASILLVDDGGDRLHYGSAPSLPAAVVQATDGILIDSGVGACGVAAQRREPVFFADMQKEPCCAEFWQLALQHDLHACWSTPVLDSAGNLVATFALYYHDCRAPQQRDLECIGRSAHLVGIAVERNHRESELRQSLSLLRIAGQTARFGGWSITVPEHSMVWSEEVFRILDVPQGTQPQLQQMEALFPEPWRARIAAAMLHCEQDGVPFSFEVPVDTPAGRRIWGHLMAEAERDDQGNIRRVQGAFCDITRRRQDEEQLRLLETCVARLNDIVMITEAEPIDDPGPRILFVNDAFERRTGYSRAEVLGKSPRFLGGPKTQRDALARIRDALSRWQPVREELINYTKTGEEFWLELDIVPVTDASGWNTHWVSIERDISERKHAEAAFNRSQAFLRMASDFVHLGAWAVDLPEMTLTWSEEVRAIHGVARDRQPTVKEAIEFYRQEDRQLMADAFQTCVNKGTPYDLELQIVTVDGRAVWVRTVGEAVRNADGEVIRVQGAFQDITQQKRAEFERQQLATRLDSTLEHMSDAFILFNRDWCFIYVNGEAERVLERKRSELLGKVIWDEFPEARGTVYDTEYQGAMADGKSRHFEAFYEPLEQWFEVNVYPSAEGLGVYFRVVTLRHQAEQALRESEERFRLLSRATHDAIWDWDLLSDRLWWNEGFETLFGYDRKDLEPDSRSWTARIHPDEHDRVVGQIQGVIDGAQDHWTDRYRFLHRDGFYVPVEDRGQVIRDAEGRPVRMVGGMTDMTERQALEAQLRQAQRLESVGQLTGGVAHDFNNLLTVILGNAELLCEELTEYPRLQPLAEMVFNAAQRGAELTQRLLAFARKQALDPKPVNLNDLVAGMDSFLRRTLGEHIEIGFVPDPDLWSALVDPGQLESALLNLCLNARDAMGKGGRICIETVNMRLYQDYVETHPYVQQGKYVMLVVSDTGSGIAPEHMARVFEPFFTTKDKGRGTGLGLAMVYGFIKQSGGHINLYSEPGHGTTVRLYLPRAEADNQRDADIDVQVADSRGHEIILLVEDDDLVARFAHDQLVALGYQVQVAANGPEALQILQGSHPFDLLFTDVVMPGGMSGRELAMQAQQLRPGLSVLYTSGYTENSIVHHGRLDPGVQLLGKPYRRADLAAKIREVLDKQGRSK